MASTVDHGLLDLRFGDIGDGDPVLSLDPLVRFWFAASRDRRMPF